MDPEAASWVFDDYPAMPRGELSAVVWYGDTNPRRELHCSPRVVTFEDDRPAEAEGIEIEIARYGEGEANERSHERVVLSPDEAEELAQVLTVLAARVRSGEASAAGDEFAARDAEGRS